MTKNITTANSEDEYRIPVFITLHQNLISYYELSFEQLHSGSFQGINAHGFNTLSGFVLTCAFLESYLDFLFNTSASQHFFGEEVSENLKNTEEVSEKSCLLDKTYFYPKVAFGKTYNKGAPPFQDLHLIVKIRNQIAHDSTQKTPRKYVNQLRSKGLLLEDIFPELSRSNNWFKEVSTLEVMRWQINTIENLNSEIWNFTGIKDHPKKYKFKIISEAKVMQLMKNKHK